MDDTIISMEKGKLLKKGRNVNINFNLGRESGDGMEQTVEAKLEQNKNTSVNMGKKANSSGRPLLPRKDSVTIQESIHARRSSNAGSASSLPLPGLHTLYRRPEVVTRSLAPSLPKGELIPMKPRLVTPITNLPEHKKTKPPKFIPYEPYPGAVNPIGIVSHSGRLTPNAKKINKNNLDIAVLVSQMQTMRSQELGESNKEKVAHETPAMNITESDVQKLKEELTKLKEERDYYKAQFKFQTQVNSELKSLLVASVGEDLQTHVNVLTEDKLQLARALLDTANNLTTHTEQIEFLAGQCEVWRSKFLASSVMVEELARWKADLTHKNQMLTESSKQLLHSTHQIREIQLEALRNLKFLAKIRYLNLPSTDVISLSAENLNILQQMVLHSGVGMPEANLNISSASTNPLCESEKYAVKSLEFVSQPLMATDEAIRALFSQVQRPYGNPRASNPEQSPNNETAASANEQQ